MAAGGWGPREDGVGTAGAVRAGASEALAEVHREAAEREGVGRAKRWTERKN